MVMIRYVGSISFTILDNKVWGMNKLMIGNLLTNARCSFTALSGMYKLLSIQNLLSKVAVPTFCCSPYQLGFSVRSIVASLSCGYLIILTVIPGC